VKLSSPFSAKAIPIQAPKQLDMARGMSKSLKRLKGRMETRPRRKVAKWQGITMNIIVLLWYLKYS